MKLIKYQIGGELGCIVYGTYFPGNMIPASFSLHAPIVGNFVPPHIEIPAKEAAKIIRAMQKDPEYVRKVVR